jgi:hypothetical protein
VVEGSLLDALVADAGGDHRAGGEDCHLDRHSSADRRGTAASEETGERRGQRDRAERLQRAALGPLGAGEAGALLALAQVGAQGAFLLPGQPPVELTRDLELGLVAGDPFLELLA